MKTLGLYCHIPFCRSKCAYCNFISATDHSIMPEYHKSILQNIVLYSTSHKNKIIDSIYFGGGAPSVYFEGGIPEITAAIRDHFNVAPDCEITAEANPESLTEAKAGEWAAAGINRLSIGLQSADDVLLKALGRAHNLEGFYNAYENAVNAGFENISVDIMLGLPGQTADDIETTIEVLYKLPLLRHLSVYALKLEPGTPMFYDYTNKESPNGKRPESGLSGVSKGRRAIYPDDDAATDMYETAYKLLTGYGFIRYEVSNFALAGYECRHNLKYWNLDEYLGIGVAAHSFYGGKRYAESEDINKFISGEKPRCFSLTADDIKTEYIMLKLRQAVGILLSEYYEKFGERLEEKSGAVFLLNHNIIQISNGRLFIAPDKFYIMNSVILKLLE